MTNSVGILGCGWLGKALAKTLVSQQVKVVATTQSPDKLALLSELGVQAELLSLPLAQNKNFNKEVFSCSVLVIAIPPGIRQGHQDYPDKIAELVKQAERGKVRQIILIGTTGVYQGHGGIVTENIVLNRNIAKVELLARAEQQVLTFSGQSVVLRCAGLIGTGRHPGRFFTGNRMLTTPNAHVNLIHQADVVAIICLLIEQKMAGIFNAVADISLTKKQFYLRAAKALNLSLNVSDESTSDDLGYKVSGTKLNNELGYQFTHQELTAIFA